MALNTRECEGVIQSFSLTICVLYVNGKFVTFYVLSSLPAPISQVFTPSFLSEVYQFQSNSMIESNIADV